MQPFTPLYAAIPPRRSIGAGPRRRTSGGIPRSWSDGSWTGPTTWPAARTTVGSPPSETPQKILGVW